MCDDYQPCAMLLHTLLCSTLDVTSPIYYQLLCTALSLSSSMFGSITGISQPNHLSLVKSRGQILRQNLTAILSHFLLLLFCNTVRLVRASWPFDPVYEKWRRATEKILKTSDILDRAEELKIWIQPLVFYLRSFQRWSDHYSDELFKSDQFHLETGQK